jgi:hypothetical protein
MKDTFLTFLYLFLVFSSSVVFGKENENTGWEFIRQRKDVKVYQKEVGDRIAFKGMGIIEGTPEKLIGIIHNPKRWKFWIDDLDEGKLLEKKSDFHFIFLQEIDAMWPVKNREIVFESIISRVGPSQILLEMKSVNHPSAPIKSGRVRAKVTYTKYRIDPLEGNRMQVTFENLSDPGGRIPNFMVDWASKSFPVSIIEGLRKEMKYPSALNALLPE